ncbi:MAG: AsmA-like C-terminal region-containing protein, partial [Candidatus Brocadiaceae bacterium]|nr:AsmA-like C-terminal region-containing protein [Candidatus Brocadiaceae bacterium]
EYFTAQGTFEGKDFSIPWHKNVPLTINSVSLLGKGKSVEVDSIMLTWGGKNIFLDGDINTSDEGIAFDMDMFASLLDWEVIRETLGIGDKEKNVNEDGSGVSGSKDGYFWEFPIKGVLRLHSKCFTYEQFTSNSLQANVVFNHDRIVVTITDSDLCGFFLPGELTVTPKYMLLDFQLLGSDQELKAIIDCMGDKERLMTGSLDIDAQVVALGETKDIGKTLQGDFKITAKNGRIYKGTLFAKLLAFLNFTEIFRGRIPDLAKKGFAYRSITMNGTVHNGTMIFDEVIIDGSSLGITGNGNMDLVNNRIDLNLLVSPLKTVDSIIKKTPVVGKILGGTLVAVPVGVKGDTKNPKISYSSSALGIGRRLLDIKKNTLRESIKIIRPIIPGRKSKK